MKKKQLLIGGGIAVILLLLFGVWNLWFSATKVAFINYQVISLGQISKAVSYTHLDVYKRQIIIIAE